MQDKAGTSMSKAYGQYCGLARALELVGERWTLLIVRDLMVGPRRFGDLHKGLAGIPTNILTTRLKELEQAGIVKREVLPRPEKGVAYVLTPDGLALEPALRELSLWGAIRMGDARPDEIVTPDSLTMALRTTFQPEAARGVTAAYELRFGELVLHARIADGKLSAGQGPAPDPDLVLSTGPAFRELLMGEISPEQALAAGMLSIEGDPAELKRFFSYFKLPAAPLRV